VGWMKKKPRLGSVALSLVGTPIAIGSSLGYYTGFPRATSVISSFDVPLMPPLGT